MPEHGTGCVHVLCDDTDQVH